MSLKRRLTRLKAVVDAPARARKMEDDRRRQSYEAFIEQAELALEKYILPKLMLTNEIYLENRGKLDNSHRYGVLTWGLRGRQEGDDYVERFRQIRIDIDVVNDVPIAFCLNGRREREISRILLDDPRANDQLNALIEYLLTHPDETECEKRTFRPQF